MTLGGHSAPHSPPLLVLYPRGQFQRGHLRLWRRRHYFLRWWRQCFLRREYFGTRRRRLWHTAITLRLLTGRTGWSLCCYSCWGRCCHTAAVPRRLTGRALTMAIHNHLTPHRAGWVRRCSWCGGWRRRCHQPWHAAALLRIKDLAGQALTVAIHKLLTGSARSSRRRRQAIAVGALHFTDRAGAAPWWTHASAIGLSDVSGRASAFAIHRGLP